jgi:hypothetical protein
MSETNDWTKDIVNAALSGDGVAVQGELEKFVENLLEFGVPLPEALTWANRLAALLGTGVTFPPDQ